MLTLQPVGRRRRGQGFGGVGDPDVHVAFAPGSFEGGQIGALEERPGLRASAWQMRPLSSGYVEAQSNRPGEPPAITRVARRRKATDTLCRRLAPGAAS